MAHQDDRPDLYRAGALAFWSNDDIGPQDIPVADGKVQPGTGGISSFSQKDLAWQDNKTWVLHSTSSLDPALKAVNDYGTHWSIQPSKVMTVQEYKAALSTVEAEVVPFHPLQDRGTGREIFETSNKYGQHPKSAFFVSAALRTVVQEKIPVANWDDNNYTYLTILANSILARSIKLSDLAYQTGSLLLKKQAVVGTAVLAYIKAMDEKTTGDDDEEVNWENDRTMLTSALKLDTFPALDEANQE